MTLTELAMAKPGKTLGHIRHGRGQLTDTDIAVGVVPESSTLSAEDARVYVTTDSRGRAAAAIALENIHDGHADLGIEALDEKALADSAFTQKLVVEAMRQSGVDYATLSPQVATIPRDALPQVGFHADPSGDTYSFSLAA
jgi:hypothetical protein